MLLIPSIDLRHGQVVRLFQGRYDRETQYQLSPLEVAQSFLDAGASLVHVVDLDAAREGRPVHKELIFELARSVKVKLEVGGGIRDLDTVQEYLDNGINRVILGTAAHENPELVSQALSRFPKKIVIGIDARNGKAAVSGWEKKTEVDAIELAKSYDRPEVRAIIYTEIERDGALAGPAVEGTRKMLEAVTVPVIASGGVSSMDDLEKLKPLAKLGLEGVIVGKAVYEKKINLREAIANWGQS